MDNNQYLNSAEINVLSAMIQSIPACELALNLLGPQDFTINANQTIFNTITNLYRNNSGIDITTIAEDLVKQNSFDKIGGIEYLSSLITQYITDANLKEHIDILIERTTKRQLENALKNISKELQSQKSINDILNHAEAQIVQVSSERSNVEMLPISAHIDDVVTKIEQLQKSTVNITGTSSGINNLDMITSGFQKGDLIILAARPSMGKTALSLNFALNAIEEDNKNDAVVIFSLEMPKDQLITRMISCQGHFDANRLRNKSKFSQADWSRISTTAEQLKQKNIIIDDTPGLRVLELQTKLRKLARENNVKLVIIDYLQLLTGKDSESRQQEVSNISRSLKILARELKVPIICLSQLSRLVERREEKRPLMSDLRESGAIEQDADLIMFLYRDDYYKEKNSEETTTQESNIAEILISKHRNGPTGKIVTIFIPKWGKFENYTG